MKKSEILFNCIKKDIKRILYVEIHGSSEDRVSIPSPLCQLNKEEKKGEK